LDLLERNGDLNRVTLPTLEHVELFYDPASRLERIVAANTAEMQVLYDALTGRPDRIAHSLGAATLAQFDYGFDTDGKITSIADAGGTRSFTYDDTLQLTGGGYPTPTEPRSERYAYDPEGNRTSSHLSGFYEHDSANRLIEDEDACYAYDENACALLRGPLRPPRSAPFTAEGRRAQQGDRRGAARRPAVHFP
jgi:hypothetical protein